MSQLSYEDKINLYEDKKQGKISLVYLKQKCFMIKKIVIKH